MLDASEKIDQDLQKHSQSLHDDYLSYANCKNYIVSLRRGFFLIQDNEETPFSVENIN